MQLIWECNKIVEGDRRLEFDNTTVSYKSHLELGESSEVLSHTVEKSVGHLGILRRLDLWVS